MTERSRQYGEIVSSDNRYYRSGQKILSTAIRKGLLESPYCNVDGKHRGSALNHDIYDIAPGLILIQRRYTTCTKYGNSPKKDYFMLLNIGKKVIKIDAPKKMSIVRMAKKNPRDGDIIKHITGEKNPKRILAGLVAVRMGVMPGREVV